MTERTHCPWCATKFTRPMHGDFTCATCGVGSKAYYPAWKARTRYDDRVEPREPNVPLPNSVLLRAELIRLGFL